MTGKPDVPKHLFSAISVGRLLDHPAANDTPEKNAFIEKCMPVVWATPGYQAPRPSSRPTYLEICLSSEKHLGAKSPPPAGLSPSALEQARLPRQLSKEFLWYRANWPTHWLPTTQALRSQDYAGPTWAGVPVTPLRPSTTPGGQSRGPTAKGWASKLLPDQPGALAASLAGS